MVENMETNDKNLLGWFSVNTLSYRHNGLDMCCNKLL